jgi:hypothetical protein
MNKPKRTLWLYAIAGALWLFVAIRNLRHTAEGWEIALSFIAAFCFLALAVAQAWRLRHS